MGTGFAATAGVKLLSSMSQRVYYSLSLTFIVILLYWIRSALLQQTLKKWKTRTKAKTVWEDSAVSEHECDLIGSSKKYHRRVYTISHRNYFFRKAFGIMIALPWEMTLDGYMEELELKQSMAITVRVGSAMIASFILSYFGFKLIEIEQATEAHSTTGETNRCLQQNYKEIKKMKTNVVETDYALFTSL